MTTLTSYKSFNIKWITKLDLQCLIKQFEKPVFLTFYSLSRGEAVVEKAFLKASHYTE